MRMSRSEGPGSGISTVSKWWKERPQIEQSSSRWGLAVLCVLLVAIFHLTLGNFATSSNLIGILTNSVPLLVAAVAAGRLLIAGAIDLSIGGSYALLTVVCGYLITHTSSVLVAILGTLVAGAAIGALNGTLARRIQINPIIITVALGSIYAGSALVSTSGNAFFNFPTTFLAISQSEVNGIPFSLIIALCVFVVSSLVLTRTVSGVRSYAIGGNPLAARLNGIRVDRHHLLLYISQQVAMAVAAVLTSAQVGSSSPTTGLGFEISILTAVMIGGVAFAGGGGKPVGIFIGVLTMGIVQAGFVFAGFSSYMQQIAQGALLVLALSVDQIVAWRRNRAKKVGLTTGGDIAELLEIEEVSRPAQIGAPVLECAHLAKAYGAVAAARDVSLTVHAGEVVCLVGDNGAGKSTVIKMLSGVVAPDSGSIAIDGKTISFESPSDARSAGIETVYQELGLVPNLGVALNLTLGREPRRRRLAWLGLIDLREASNTAARQLARVGVKLNDVYRPIADFSGGQRQSTAIARATVDSVKVMILDEPTAALGVRQTANVLKLVRRLAANGSGVLLVTHDVEAIMEVADRVVVLNLGSNLFEGSVAELSQGKLIHLMAGYAPKDEEPARGADLHSAMAPQHAASGGGS